MPCNSDACDPRPPCRCPAKIDIGPVFNVDPQKRSAYGGLGADRVFAPVERELVFDVVRASGSLPQRGTAAWRSRARLALPRQDMTDYDDIRTCCSGGAICGKCWPFMTVRADARTRVPAAHRLRFMLPPSPGRWR